MSSYPAVDGHKTWKVGQHSVGDAVARMSGVFAGGRMCIGELAVSSAGATDAGPRPTNDDEFLVARLGKPDDQGAYAAQLLLVADGVGGLPCAQEASCITSQVAFEHLERRAGELCEAGERTITLARDLAADFFADAELALTKLQSEQWLSRTPGSTLTAALIVDGKLVWMHAGDTRCYVLRHETLHQVTTDHNIFTQIRDSGVLDVNPALKSYLTNCVGADTGPVRVDVGLWELAAGDVVLLCSDGLTNSVAEQDIQAILTEKTDPAQSAQTLVRRAIDNETSDNVTVVVARVG